MVEADAAQAQPPSFPGEKHRTPQQKIESDVGPTESFRRDEALCEEVEAEGRQSEAKGESGSLGEPPPHSFRRR